MRRHFFLQTTVSPGRTHGLDDLADSRAKPVPVRLAIQNQGSDYPLLTQFGNRLSGIPVTMRTGNAAELARIDRHDCTPFQCWHGNHQRRPGPCRPLPPELQSPLAHHRVPAHWQAPSFSFAYRLHVSTTPIPCREPGCSPFFASRPRLSPIEVSGCSSTQLRTHSVGRLERWMRRSLPIGLA